MMMINEMKLADLAKLVCDMKPNEVINFAPGTEEDANKYGGWCGVKRCYEYDPDNDMFIIGHYGGEAYVRLYHISTYDERLGDFIDGEYGNSDIMVISKMLADFMQFYDGGVSGIFTVEYDRTD